MRKAAFLLLLGSLLFAQDEVQLSGAMYPLRYLCGDAKSFVSSLGMLGFVVAVIALVARAAISHYKENDKRFEFPKMVLLAIGVLAILLTLLCVVVYFGIQPFISMETGAPVACPSRSDVPVCQDCASPCINDSFGHCSVNI